MSKVERKALKGINTKMSNDKITKAYPNYDQYMSYNPPRNTNKWISAAKDMYYRIHKGTNKTVALDNIIAGWDDMEKLDFKNWLRYYEENAHKKYSEASNKPIAIKVGQVGYWEDVNRAGYFVPVHREAPQDDPRSHVHEIDLARAVDTNEGIKADQKREIIEAQRNKIVSRLDSAEKLLRSHEGQIFAGKEFEALMHIIYELKKKIHTVNKISIATKLYEDMIVREANILNRQGFVKASQVLFKIAEDKPLAAAPPASPLSPGGLPGTVPGTATGETPPSNPPAQIGPPPAAKKVDDGMKGFLNGLSGKKDNQPADNLEVLEADDTWVVEAQAAPEAPPNAEVMPPAPDENLEVKETPEEQTDKETPEPPAGSGFDQKMNQMLQGVTIEDIVQKLEDNTKIYKTRQMPRELALIDMMLDHLGLAPYFPTLAEATNKALDANQYILTRLEDITSRLRGTVQTNEIDLKGQNAIPSSPELDATRNKLQDAQDQEKARKQMKKDQENAQVAQQGKPEPELEVAEDLGGPVETTNAVPPPPAEPVAPPPAPAR